MGSHRGFLSLGKISTSNDNREERYGRPYVHELSFVDEYRVKVMDRTTAQCDGLVGQLLIRGRPDRARWFQINSIHLSWGTGN
jgi:hypothetical protein